MQTDFAAVCGALLRVAVALMAGAIADPDTVTAQLKDATTLIEALNGETRGPGPSTGGGGRAQVPILFELDSARIADQSAKQVEEVARALVDPSLASNQFRIEGHTDRTGDAAYNLDLSKRRAAAVKRALVRRYQIAPERLIARGYGESRSIPGIVQDSEAGRAMHRRVVVVNLGRLDEPPRATGDQPRVPDNDDEVTGLLQLELGVGDQARKVKPGDVLETNDKYRIVVRPSARSFVYIYRFNAAGMPRVLLPNPALSSARNPLDAGQIYTVPESGDDAGPWLTLDGGKGTETIVAISSDRSLKDPRVEAINAFAGAPRGPLAPVPLDGGPAVTYSTFTFRHR